MTVSYIFFNKKIERTNSMNDYWIVIGNASGDISYGVSERYYIFGVSNTKEEAQATMAALSTSEDPVKVSSNQGSCFLANTLDGIVECASKEDLMTGDELLNYCDLDYTIVCFTGAPVPCGGAWYLE